MRSQIAFAQGAQGVQADDVRVVQGAQALHVEHHNLAQERQLGAHFERLVQLLVVFDKQHRGARVFAQVVHLAAGVGGVNAVGHAAG